LATLGDMSEDIERPAPAKDLICPSCRSVMAALSLDGPYGGTLQIDLCHTCEGLWFDSHEHLQLTPRATLRLFEIIHDARRARQPLRTRLECPRCRLRLLATHDRQRNTPFQYWRCGRGHGRFITFFDFLRQKDFVRPLDARQVAELKASVQSVNCSNCGAPIDLANASVCGYCRTPLSMLDFAQVGRMVRQLTERDAEAGSTPSEAAHAVLALALIRERRQVEAAFSQYEQGTDWSGAAGGGGLVEAGIGAVVDLLRRLR
jgi:Zn-finger nucleic acid-binding protein